MSTQVFNTEQEAIDHANQPAFALLCLTQWGLSAAHAQEVAKRILIGDPLSEGDAGWLSRLNEARASFVRMAKP